MTAAAAPRRQPAELPEGFWYSVKCRALGPPLVTEQLKNQRLSRPLALGVLSCDGLSSAADSTGELTAVFYGRTQIAGLEPGRRVRLRGMVGIGADGRPAMINPAYDLLA